MCLGGAQASARPPATLAIIVPVTVVSSLRTWQWVVAPSPELGEWEDAAGGGALGQHHQSPPSSCLFLEKGEHVSRWG